MHVICECVLYVGHQHFDQPIRELDWFSGSRSGGRCPFTFRAAKIVLYLGRETGKNWPGVLQLHYLNWARVILAPAGPANCRLFIIQQWKWKGLDITVRPSHESDRCTRHRDPMNSPSEMCLRALVSLVGLLSSVFSQFSSVVENFLDDYSCIWLSKVGLVGYSPTLTIKISE